MNLIPNWRSALYMLSVQASVINAAGLSAWAGLGELRERIPVILVIGFALTMLVLGVAGRLIKQESVSGDKPTDGGAS